ncbi:MAG: hypothetical protein WC614_08630 [bacterium]
MKRLSWQVRAAIILIILSVLLYMIFFAVFKDANLMFMYLLAGLAFLPIEILLVTFILNKLLTEREKRILLEKMNMVIGVFFSEIGTKLIIYFSDFDPELDKIKKDLIVTDSWSEKKFNDVSLKLKSYDYVIESKKIDLKKLKTFLKEKRNFSIRLLENPNLLEHESFTELLRALFHLTEELESRDSMENLPENDYKHLNGDIKRVYVLLVHQWLDYMKYLKNNYPYLFSLAMRTNPFDKTASPYIK